MLAKFKNLKIIQKLTIGFLIVAMIAAAIGAVGIVNTLNIKQSDTALYEQNTLGLQYSGAAGVNFQQLRYYIFKLSTLTRKADAAETLTFIDQFRTATNNELAEFNKINSSDEVNTLVGHLEEAWSDYQAHLDIALQHVDAGDMVAAKASIIPSMVDIGIVVRDDYLNLFQLVSTEAAARAGANAQNAQTSVLIMAIAVAIGIIISMVLGTFIARMIGNPLKKMALVADMLSIGDINTNSILDNSDRNLNQQTDEIGKLSKAFTSLIETTKKQVATIQLVADGNLMVDVEIRSENDQLGIALKHLVESLNQVVATIVLAADQVAAGSALVADTSTALSHGATSQASSVQQLTASLEELSAQIGLNAQNAKKANDLATDAKNTAVTGNDQMKEMISAMDTINVSSTNISKIIKVIDDIAFQTNILALNAAVEAARAGQHGKGFAVVAEEVRTLAARSANAAKDTTAMIENSIKSVESGSKIAQNTANALASIVSQVENAAEFVGSIAIASNEQAIGIEQLNQGVIQISQVVQTTAATSEESAAASEELSSQAESLKQTISVFKTENSGTQNKFLNKPRTHKPHLITDSSNANKRASKISLNDDSFGKY